MDHLYDDRIKVATDSSLRRHEEEARLIQMVTTHRNVFPLQFLHQLLIVEREDELNILRAPSYRDPLAALRLREFGVQRTDERVLVQSVPRDIVIREGVKGLTLHLPVTAEDEDALQAGERRRSQAGGNLAVLWSSTFRACRGKIRLVWVGG